jgi:hypothetical protein
MNLFTETTQTPFAHLLPLLTDYANKVGNKVVFVGAPLLFDGKPITNLTMEDGMVWLETGSAKARLPITTSLITLS